MHVRRRWRLALGAVALLALLGQGSAAAAPLTTITIDVNDVALTETFTTTGGILCPSGTATTDFHHFGGSFASAAGSFHLTKTLECADGTGSFTIRVNAATVFGSSGDQGGWSVVGGSDDYTGLKGGGRLVGTYVPTGIIDVYTGFVSN